MESEDIDVRRKRRRGLETELLADTERGLSTFRKVSYGMFAGVAITTSLLDPTKKVAGMIISWVCLLLFIGYKLYERSESKRNSSYVEIEYPHRELYPDSPIYNKNRKANKQEPQY
jgi:hypothetical protein